MNKILTDNDLYKAEIRKNGQIFNHVPATEKIKALRSNYEIDTKFGIETSYEIIKLDTTFGSIVRNNTLVIFTARITDQSKENYPVIATGTDSKFFLYSFPKDIEKILEEADFFSKAETGAVSRALTNLGIGLPTVDDLEKRANATNNGGGNSYKKPYDAGYASATNNTTKPGDKSSDNLIENYTGLTVGELRKDGGVVVQFETGEYLLKYNPDKKSYYWSNVDKTAKDKYISTTVK